MSAESVIYYLKRPPAEEPVDETEWLFSALGQFTPAELRELLYIAQGPDFFETMRAMFALPARGGSGRKDFLPPADPRPVNVPIALEARCVLPRGAPQPPARPRLKIVE